jgi:hypothetical protein
MPGHTGPVRQPSSRAMAHCLWKIICHCKKIEVHRGLEPATWRKGVGLLYH